MWQLPDDKVVNVSAYMEANTDYTPVITTEVNEDSDDIGTSGGGCDSGLGIAGFIAFVSLISYLKKK